MSLFKSKKRCKTVDFIIDYAFRSKKNDRYKNKFYNLANKVSYFEEFAGIILYNDNYTDVVAEDFLHYIRSLNFCQNTVMGYIQHLAFIYNKMRRAGFDINTSYEDVKVKGEFITKAYLTIPEIKQVHALNLPDQAAIVRDLFLVACYTGMRYADFMSLTDVNLYQENMLMRKTEKTGETVVIPQHPIVKDILNRHNGFPEYRSSAQNFNKVLKTICKYAGIDSPVLVECTKGFDVQRKVYKKYELISSHAGRRSFATNAYFSGIPTARIMLMTGHKTQQSFFNYIRIDKIENALTLSEHPFFLDSF